MADLPISGQLDVTVNQASLRNAKSEVEDEIDDLAIDVNVSGEGGRGGNVRGREEAMSRRLLSQQLDGITEIESTLTGFDLSDQWDLQHELSRTRNDLLEELADATGSGGGLGGNTRGRRGGDGGGGGGLGGLLGLLAGGAGLLAGGALALDQPDEIPVEQPEPVGYGGPKPIPVEDPGDVGYGGPDPIPVEEPGDVGYTGPTPIPVEDPTTSPGGDGTGTGTGDGTGTGSGDSTGTGTDGGGAGTGPFGQPLQLPEFDLPDVGAEEVAGGVTGGVVLGGAAKLASDLSKSIPKGVGGGIGFPSPGGIIAGIAGDAKNKKPSNRGPVGGALTDIFNTGRRGAGGRIAAGGAPLMMATTPALSGSGGGDQKTANRTAQSRGQQPEIRFNPTYNLNADDLERQMKEDVKELRRRLDELERGITGR